MKREMGVAEVKPIVTRNQLIRFWQLTLLILLTFYLLPSAMGQSGRGGEYDRDDRYNRQEWYDPDNWFDDNDGRTNRRPRSFWDSLFDFDSNYEGFDPDEFLAEQHRKEMLRYRYDPRYRDPRIQQDRRYWNPDDRRSTSYQNSDDRRGEENEVYSRTPSRDQTYRYNSDKPSTYSGDTLDRNSDPIERSDRMTETRGQEIVEGELVRFDWLVESFGSPQAVRMTLRTDDNDVRYIQFGTALYQEDRLTLRNGDSVEMGGRYIYLDSRPVFQVQEIRSQYEEGSSLEHDYAEAVRGRVIDMRELKVGDDGRIEAVLLELRRSDGLPLTFLIGASEDYYSADKTLRKFDKVELEGDYRTFDGEQVFTVTDVEERIAVTSD